ncbi:LuxR C-terminal-related transcriptional regulator [Streptomyces fuscichromogenes]|uniref:LuxR C-terminal-related transcriptional regulator n=1 Tax=Streptomyces fuscichromogenes TaxID=1324013 RepID=UPI001E2D5801|nr:LuxR C-terminal-related transcriptional regulator [Streptomyces fuscichromogenes]
MAARDDSARGPAVGYADPLGEPFLRTRFAVPARPATFVRRPRLTAHLDQALDTPLTMVNGAAGAGKTLLVADWAARLGQPVAWLTNEAGDQDPGKFWAYALHALHTAGTPLSAGVGGSPGDLRMVDHRLLARLADELNGRDRPAILVLDEFDRLAAPETAEQLEFVLHHAGQGLRLVLVTRTEPLLPLHRYRAAAAMTEIRNHELAFTPEEAADLLARHGLRLPAEAARALVERTGGWAAGLRLSALAAQQSTDPETYLKEFEAGHSTIADFLLAEVVGRQPPETQDLLLRVSVLDRFGPELAEALTGRPDAGPLLAGLCRQNAFVEDLGHSWYRLRPLFGEILRVHLRARDPGLEPELHRRAAWWLRAHGAVPEALAHGAAAADWECTAGALVDDLAIGRLLTGLRADDLTELFSGMGPEAGGPAVDLVRAARELSEHDLDHGLAHLGRAEQSLATGAAAAAGRLSCVLLESLAARLTGCPDRAERAMADAAPLRREVPAHLLAKHPELTALLLSHLGSARVWAGHFDAARAALTEVADLPGGALTELPREDCLGHLALIDYFDGWLDLAERRALAATDATRHCGGRPFPGAGLGQLVLAAVAVDRDELCRARSLLDEAAESGPGPGVPDPVTEACRALVTGRLHRALGDARTAANAADPAVRAEVTSPWARADAALAVAAVLLADGRPGPAAEVLAGIGRPGGPVCAADVAWAQLAAGRREEAVGAADRLCTETEGRTGPGVTVRATLVRARAAAEAGDTDTARKLLARALLEARRDRLRRPFLDAGPGIRRLLDTPPLHGLAAGWLHGDGPGADAPPLLVEELSGREREVLARLAQMMSTQEIAADLYVSVNTVKTHLKSVYRKLGVGRRGDAVRRARERGLL